MPVALFSHKDCLNHSKPGHPERPERLAAIWDRLERTALLQEVNLYQANEATPDLLSRVHPISMLQTISEREPASGNTQLDPDTYLSAGSHRAAALAAGAVATAVEQVTAGHHTRAFCAVRPPGHHAEVSQAMGFCLYNSVAIGAELALAQPGIERVAILDFDVHHCNGTVDIFKDRPEVLVCSSFQEDFYPFRYLDFSNEHIVNTPLAAGTRGDHFRRTIASTWWPALEAHQPDLIMLSAGFDAHALDPLAQLELSSDDFAWITRECALRANTYCEGRLVSTLEGGYSLEALSESVARHLGELVSLPADS